MAVFLNIFEPWPISD